MLDKRWNQLEKIGISDYFITENGNASQELESFIYVKPMQVKPLSPTDCDKDLSIFHFVLTGWKDKYWVKHPNFFKIQYSSHSSTKELQDFVKIIEPANLIFNVRNIV